MTKKHFEALAKALRECRVINKAQWEEDCKTIAWTLAQSNAAFDRMRFLDACGLK